MNNLCKEFWKDVTGFEGYYQVSNFCRVKSLERFRLGRNGTPTIVKERLLKEKINQFGYKTVALSKHGKYRYFFSHRIGMEAFVQNQYNLPFVNHKDENKLNNFIWVNDDGTVDLEKSNLEWCTSKFNANWGTRNKRVTEKITNGKLSKPVLQYDSKGNFIREWPSLGEIRRTLGCSKSYISDCCKGKFSKGFGYIWKFKEGA